MKTGRPKLKRGLAKSVQIGVRFTASEFKTVKAAHKRTKDWGGKQIGSWARHVLLDCSRRETFGTFEFVKTKKKIPKNFVGWQTERIIHRI